MKQSARLSIFLAASCIAGAAIAGTINENREVERQPDGKGGGYEVHGNGKANPGSGGKTVGSNGIQYHGGPVMTAPEGANVYYIWYGAWNNNATTILTDLVKGLSRSPIYAINTGYYNSSNVPVSNIVNFKGEAFDNYSLGKSLSDANIQTIVANAIKNGLPKDTNGVYFVLTAADVAETSGFGSRYCGWHTHGTITGSDIKYAFVGDASVIAPTGCIAITAAQSPSGNLGADGMASVIYHELSEAVTDPDLNAWYDRRGAENADKCAWQFGATYMAPNGGVANVRLGTGDYLLQQNWVNAGGGYCSLSY